MTYIGKENYVAIGLKEGDLPKPHNYQNNNPRMVKIILGSLSESNHVCDECGQQLQYKTYSPKGAKNAIELTIAGGPVCIHYFCPEGHYSETKTVEEWIDIFKGNNL